MTCALQRTLPVCVWIGLCCLAVNPAGAHPLAPALLLLREDGAGSVEVEWRVPRMAVRGAPRTAVLPPECPAVDAGHWSEDDNRFTRRWRIDCGAAGLGGQPIAVDGLRESRTDALVRVERANGQRFEHLLRPSAPEWVVPKPAGISGASGGAGSRLLRFGALGVEHIATGADHLLFLLALLLLVPGRAALVRTITAFTLGHSLTLGLAVLGFLRVPAALAELAIAGSLLAMAVELATGARGPLARNPWRAAGLFGLLHGLGFAAALREVGLPANDIPLALAGFNLGIELGQLLFVAAALMLAAIARRPGPVWPGRLRVFGVHALGSLAAYWCWVRAYALLA